MVGLVNIRIPEISKLSCYKTATKVMEAGYLATEIEI